MRPDASTATVSWFAMTWAIPAATNLIPERACCDRHGTSSFYAALDVQSGEVIGSPHRRHRAVEFLKFLKTIDHAGPGPPGTSCSTMPAATKHRPSDAGSRSTPQFHLHFTPTSSSWINLVVRWSSELTTRLLRRGRTPSLAGGVKRAGTV
jgi:hypothetical protein